VKLLVDAQLPRRLARSLREAGHDAVHTLDLPARNRTTDREINALSLREERIVVTKDADFVDSFLLAGQPFKLLLVSTGNITNAELQQLFARNLTAIGEAFDSYSFIEIDRASLTVHV
jgi:predicted nuclease of predicted toxin-antitoxin system